MKAMDEIRNCWHIWQQSHLKDWLRMIPHCYATKATAAAASRRGNPTRGLLPGYGASIDACDRQKCNCPCAMRERKETTGEWQKWDYRRLG